jgi:hypothetical protein
MLLLATRLDPDQCAAMPAVGRRIRVERAARPATPRFAKPLVSAEDT